MNRGDEPVLRLPFREALVPSRFAQDLNRSSEKLVLAEIRRTTGISVQGAKLLIERGELRVAFDKGAQGVRLMRDKAGRELATLVDASGKTTANARRVGKSLRIASGAATAALAVVEVAHVISGHDNAKRLQKVEVGVDRLLHAHEAELKAKLQAIYARAKEILSHGFESVIDQQRQELNGYCRDLFEIRSRWVEEFKFNLDHIKAAKPGLVRTIVRIGKEKAHARARSQRATEVNGELATLQLINFSIILQTVLSAAAGRSEEFQDVTLPDEVERWLDVLEFAEQRCDKIGGEGAVEFRPFLRAIADTIEVWIQTVPPPRNSRLQRWAIGG